MLAILYYIVSEVGKALKLSEDDRWLGMELVWAITLDYADQQRECGNRNNGKCFDQRRLEVREDSKGRSEWQKQQDSRERQREEVISIVDASTSTHLT